MSGQKSILLHFLLGCDGVANINELVACVFNRSKVLKPGMRTT